MLVSGLGVIKFFGPVFNGIEQGSGWDIFGLIASTLALLVSAACYYYLKSARRNPKTYTDLSILESKVSIEKKLTKKQ